VGKYNIDDILSELGVDGKPPTAGKPGPGANGAAPAGRDGLMPVRVAPKKHRIDPAEQGDSPLPFVPGNQRGFGQPLPEAPPDPAARQVVKASSGPSMGPVIRDIYSPQDEEKGRELGEMMLAKGIVTAERLTVAQQVIKQSPGRRLSDVLVEQGADEVAIQTLVAEMAGVPFERIDLEKALEGGFDGKLLQRLTPEFCKQHMVIPLRTDGNRVVIGATQCDDVYMIDEVRQRLGTSLIPHQRYQAGAGQRL